MVPGLICVPKVLDLVAEEEALLQLQFYAGVLEEKKEVLEVI